MKLRKLQPQHHGWIESILDKELVDFLWEELKKVKKMLRVDWQET